MRREHCWKWACLVAGLGLVSGLMIIGCDDEPKKGDVELAETADDFGVIERVRRPVRYRQIPYFGDLWTMTWADDGHLYTIFGDGTGMKDRLPTLLMGEPDEFDENYVEVRPGWFKIKDPADKNAAEWTEIYDGSKAYQQAPYTPAGVVRLKGAVPDFALSDEPQQDVVSRHIPYGTLHVFTHMDKPSSLVAVGRRFYAHMHYPPGAPTRGYLAWSDDRGKTWHKVSKPSPWGKQSPFRVTMFFNMGQAYAENRDGFMYGLGIGQEISLDPPKKQSVYLLRVPLDKTDRPPDARRDPVLDYDAYRYFSGFDDSGQPAWSEKASDAKPMENVFTMCQGSAMYHPQLDRYLFLSGFATATPIHRGKPGRGEARTGELPAGAVFEAPHPWGPWRVAGQFPAGFIASFIPKGTDEKSVWITGAGGGGLTYALNVGRLKFQTRHPRVTPAHWRLNHTRKVEQVIGNIDFETLKPTRQRTQTQTNLMHSDLGASFEHQGRLWFLFGDSDPESPGWDEYHDDAIAWTKARSIDDFKLTFLKVPNGGRGYLNPRIRGTVDGSDPDLDVDLGTLNVPLAGLSDGDSAYVWFTTGGAQRSLVARSDDGFRTFKKVFDFGRTHFVDVAVDRARGSIPGIPESKEGHWVLVFGSGNKSNHHVYLAAMPIEGLRRCDRSTVRFLKGATPGQPQWKLAWSHRESDAIPIFRIEHGTGPGVMSEVPHGWGFGEPLIHYNRTMGCWVATYNSARRTIRLRTARNPWGPWSESIILFDPSADYGEGPAFGRYIGDDQTERLGGQGELYGPYVIERFTKRMPDGRIKLAWLLSPWQPYTVLLMESTLEKDGKNRLQEFRD